MNLVIPQLPLAVVPVFDCKKLFPVRRIYCVGQNYAAHVREMGGDPAKTKPVFFSKPADSVVINDAAIAYPLATENLHYEAELVVALSSGGQNLSADAASQRIFGYGVGIDFTRRDLQVNCKAKGQPWDVAKGFDNSAPISAIKPIGLCNDVDRSRIWLSVNDEMRQDANTDDMIWDVPAIIAELSRYFKLHSGDLIFTGTPSGVSAVSEGDNIQAGVDGIGVVNVKIEQCR
ncbi:MAG: fumarylacetoacetate hydrolase family protein [Pseudohongiellaceae bacterium]